MLALDETIVALASPQGGAARGVVRVSGPDALRLAASCFFAEDGSDWTTGQSAQVKAGRLHLHEQSTQLPCEAYVWPTARSYARSPTVELHTLGSPPLLRLVLAMLCASGCRLAQPGEFTCRAFLAGRIDLTQAEAVLGVIDAAGDDDLRTAVAQLAGGLSRPLHALRERLLDLLAELEAGLDFAEEDIRFIEADVLRDRLDAADKQVRELLEQLGARSTLADAPRAVLIGRPNVGKSSLFNALARQSAIVSDVPGTTRDYLKARLDLDGVAVDIVDTAGIETAGAESVAPSAIQASAQSMTGRQQQQSQLHVLCLEAGQALTDWEVQAIRSAEPNVLCVLTKTDALRDDALANLPGIPADAVATSAATGAGLDTLRSRLRAAAMHSPRAGVVAGTAERCRESLCRAADSLRRAKDLAGVSDELVAAELRSALAELGLVVGAVYTDDILDRIFSRFCIGK